MTKAREKGNNFGKVYKKGQPAKNGLSCLCPTRLDDLRDFLVLV